MRFRPRIAVALLSTLAFVVPSVARAQIPDSAIPLQTVISETNRFRAEYAEYYNNKDVAALAAMYAPGAIITLEDGTTYVGQEAIKAALTKMAPTFPHLIITSDSMVAFGHTAIDVGSTTQHPQGGGELTSRYLVVLRKGMKDWKIVRLSVVSVMPKKM
jgi:ketosteroid isomerase-like protein